MSEKIQLNEKEKSALALAVMLQGNPKLRKKVVKMAKTFERKDRTALQIYNKLKKGRILKSFEDTDVQDIIDVKTPMEEAANADQKDKMLSYWYKLKYWYFCNWAMENWFTQMKDLEPPKVFKDLKKKWDEMKLETQLNKAVETFKGEEYKEARKLRKPEHDMLKRQRQEAKQARKKDSPSGE